MLLTYSVIGLSEGKFTFSSKSDGKFETTCGKGINDLILDSLLLVWLLHAVN